MRNLLDILAESEPDRAAAIRRHTTREGLAEHMAKRRSDGPYPSQQEIWASREHMAKTPRTKGKK